MKKAFLYRWMVLPFLLLLAVSCKHYTDVVPTGKTIFTTFDDYNKLLNNSSFHVYQDADFLYLNDQVGFSEIQVTNVLAGGAWDMNTINYMYNAGQSRTTFAKDASYKNPYAAIANYSLVIEYANTATTGTDAQKRQLIAEARALRAYNHFVLVNMYAKPYDPATAATDNAIIIKKNFDIDDAGKPATIAQVYDFIEAELKAAIPDLSGSPDNPFHPSKAFGYGLLAKMYLFKGDVTNALTAATQSLAENNYIFDLVQYKQRGGIDPVDISMQENLYYGIGGSTLTSPSYSNGYLLNKEMYNSFEAGDVRVDPLLYSTSTVTIPAGSGYAAYIKTTTGATRFCYNTSGLRTTDVYLILAECYARKGDIQNAIKYVDAVRVKRIMPANFIPSIATDTKSAVNMVIAERKKEFLFGHNRFWDLRRLGREPDYAITVKRILPSYATGYTPQTYTLPPNSPLLIIPMSRNVLTNNLNLIQNSYDGR